MKCVEGNFRSRSGLRRSAGRPSVQVPVRASAWAITATHTGPRPRRYRPLVTLTLDDGSLHTRNSGDGNAAHFSHGWVSSEAAEVTVDTSDGRQVTATTTNGYLSRWWGLERACITPTSP